MAVDVVTAASGALAAVGFLYWPLLYVRVRGLFSEYALTKRKTAASALLAAAAAATASGVTYLGGFIPLMLAVAVMSAFLLFAVPKTASRRTRAKIIILSAYLHVAWQLLPVIDVSTVAVEAAAVIAVIFLAKITSMTIRRAKKKKIKSREEKPLSISDLWAKPAISL